MRMLFASSLACSATWAAAHYSSSLEFSLSSSGPSLNRTRISFPRTSTHLPAQLLPLFRPPMATSSTASVPSTDDTTPPTPPPANEDVSASAHILEPSQKEGTDAVLFFLPGAFTAPSEYFPLVKAVQARCGFRLWAVVLDPGNAVVMTPMVEASFDGVLERVKQLGFQSGAQPSRNIFVVGHSWGAWASRSIAMKRAEAFIQLASCFHLNPDNLLQYPKPVLTLSGELDGQITLAAVAKHAGEIQTAKSELGEFFTYAIKPVVIVPGMNHAQFSHGIPNKERGDLDADISIEHARAISADIISSFITVHVFGPTKDKAVHALTVLREAVRNTHDLYRTLWDAIEAPGRDIKKLQLELAALSSLTESNVGVVQHDYKDNFIYSKPLIDVASKHIIVNTFLSPIGNLKILNNLWVKFKSREAVASAFRSSEEQQEPLAIGAYFNEKAFAQAITLVPEVTRKKFQERGKKLRFLEDLVIKSSAQDWIDSDLIMKPADDGTGYVDVQSTAIISPVHGIAARFAGMHYFKLLTVARAMHWIFVDSYQ